MVTKMKKLCFCITSGYNMVVSVDSENNCKYLVENEHFPYITGLDHNSKVNAAKIFLESLEDDDCFEPGIDYSDIFTDDVQILTYRIILCIDM